MLEKIKVIYKSQFFKSTGIYTISSFLNASVPFLLLPFLTVYLTRADYGIVATFLATMSFMLPLLTINMNASIARAFYIDKIILSRYIGNVIIVFIINFIVYLSFFYAFQNQISTFVEIPKGQILLLPLICASQFLPSIILSLFQVRSQAFYYGLVQITLTILTAGLAYFLIRYINLGWVGRIYGILIVNLVFTIISIFILLRNKDVYFSFNKADVNHALKFGVGLIPHVIGGMFIILSSRIILTRLISVEATGLYSVAHQISSVIGFFTMAFNNAFVPWLYSKLNLNNEDIKLRIVKNTYIYISILFLFCAIYIAIIPLLFETFIDEKFREAISFCKWIVLGYFFQGAYFMVTNYISYSEKTYLQSIVTIIIGLLNIPIMLYCIKYFGVIGAAISFSVTFFIFFVSTWAMSKVIYPMPWFYFRYNK